ncbi:hypothetical protein [Actinoallomurus acanthiterrae]
MDDVIDGHHSLKAHEENTGLAYRTVPATVPFIAGHKYTVSFKYQTNLDGQWAWVTGADTVGDGKVASRTSPATRSRPRWTRCPIRSRSSRAAATPGSACASSAVRRARTSCSTT